MERQQSCSSAITETRTPYQCTQSASTLHKLPGECTTKSDFANITEINEGDCEAEKEEDEESEDCFVTKTLYYFPS